MEESESDLVVVGIGASAGGLKPLSDFFSAMPSDSGMAFVIIQHLSPDFKSLMAELLSSHTQMSIHVASEGMRIEKNSIYLIPVRTEMAVMNGRLYLNKVDTKDLTAFFPINTFLTSLAREYREKGIGIILSGAGSDGTEGVKEMSRSGGLVLIQDEASAQFSGMPESAQQSGVQFTSLLPADMPSQLLLHIEQLALNEQTPNVIDLKIDKNFNDILGILKKAFNIDFNNYKVDTLLRRVERRMFLSGIPKTAVYAQLLKKNQAEVDQLYRDLLVDVTHFFRDSEAFDWLADELIPKIVARKRADESIRLWIAACASGEEAYSLTILFLEEIAKQNKKNELRVFATDAHEDSIQRASRGVYSSEKAKSIPKPYLEKYFSKTDENVKVEKSLRSHIVFAKQNLLSDSLFTNLDFISCRNFLIYLHPDSQKRLLTQFHFGLKPEGILFLGPSEYLGDLENDFKKLNHTWRIFQKNSQRKLLEVSFNSTQPFSPQRAQAVTMSKSKTVVNSWMPPLFDAIAPDSILVDGESNLIQIFGEGAKYLHFPTGPIVLEIGKLLHESLTIPIRGALFQAKRQQEPVQLDNVSFEMEGEAEKLNVQVKPVEFESDDGALTHYLIIFEQVIDRLFEILGPDEKVPVSTVTYIEQLERELTLLRESLQSSLEEVEATNEELQTANEELMSSNEELQSTNEELQSVNEELYTVNTEYMLKNQELGQLNNDMRNLQRSSQILTIFLDKESKLRSFTPAAGELFGFVDHDIGRSIYHLSASFAINDEWLEEVIFKSLNQQESHHEVELRRLQKILLLNVRPFVTELDEIEGVILYFSDITAVKQAEAERADQEKLIAKISEVSPTVLLLLELPSFQFLFLSKQVSELVGYTVAEALSNERFFRQIIHPDDLERFDEDLHQRLTNFKNDETRQYTYRFKHRDGHDVWIMIQNSIYQYNAEGEVTHLMVTLTDVTESKQARIDLERQLHVIMDQMPAYIAYFNKALTIEYANPAYVKTFLQDRQHWLGKSLTDLVDEGELDAGHVGRIQSFFGKVLRGEVVNLKWENDGENGIKQYDIVLIPDIRDDEVVGCYRFSFEIGQFEAVSSELRGMKQSFVDTNERLSILNDHLPIWVSYIDRDLTFQFANKYYEQTFNVKLEDIAEQPVRAILGDDLFEKNRPIYEKALAGEHQTYQRQVREGVQAMMWVIPHEVNGEIVGFHAVGLNIDFFAQNGT